MFTRSHPGKNDQTGISDIEPLENNAIEFIDKKIRKHGDNDVNDNFLDDLMKISQENQTKLCLLRPLVLY